MKKALETIGLKKAFLFLWYTWYGYLLHLSLPPMRAWLLRLAGAHVGSDATILDVRFVNLYQHGFSRLYIGNRVFMGDEVMVDVRGGVRVEDDVTISNRATVVSHINVGFADHPLQKHYPMKESSVVIKKGAYVATGTIILAGVEVGRESVVAAGAVVNKSVSDHVLVAGVPARVIKKLS